VDLPADDYFLRLGSPAGLAYSRIHRLQVGPEWSASSSVSEIHQRDSRNLRNVLALINTGIRITHPRRLCLRHEHGIRVAGRMNKVRMRFSWRKYAFLVLLRTEDVIVVSRTW